jgi:hypothetical protein
MPGAGIEPATSTFPKNHFLWKNLCHHWIETSSKLITMKDYERGALPLSHLGIAGKSKGFHSYHLISLLKNINKPLIGFACYFMWYGS